MDIAENEFIEDLEFYNIKLRKYCHNKDCSYIYDCPENHKKCKDKLGLNTSIAWIIANKLRGFIVNYKVYDKRKCIAIKHKLFKELYISLNTLRIVVSFHARKYPKLYSFLSSISTVLAVHQNYLVRYNNYE